MAERSDVVVVGPVYTDIAVQVAVLPREGESVPAQAFHRTLAGRGVNQALAAARLGARVALVARIGDDERGHDTLAHLRAAGVDTRHVRVDPTSTTGTAMITIDRHGRRFTTTYAGANALFGVDDVRAAEAALRGARVLLTQLEFPEDALELAVGMAREGGAKVVLDPAPPRSLDRSFLARVDLLRPNSREAEALCGLRVSDYGSARAAARRLIDAGSRTVSVQAGARGNLVAWPGGEHWLPALPVDAVDPTGAGDAYAGAMAAGLAEGLDWEHAGWLATGAAAMATTAPGPQAGLRDRAAVLDALDGHAPSHVLARLRRAW